MPHPPGCKSVYLEKPPAISQAEALEVAEAAAQRPNQWCQFGFHLRFDDRVMDLKRRVDAG
jgi:predicted dehydrogenase